MSIEPERRTSQMHYDAEPPHSCCQIESSPCNYARTKDASRSHTRLDDILYCRHVVGGGDLRDLRTQTQQARKQPTLWGMGGHVINVERTLSKKNAALSLSWNLCRSL